ncbi:MAG: glycoside hydrolase family 16 [Fibrobacteres bacterium]|nr:glycoside hydrolase family 16 [Fibrobacterota bacterium]
MKWPIMVVAAAFSHCIQNPGTGPKPQTVVMPPPDWQLVWSDEFDGDKLDTAKWSYQIAHGCELGICGWGNNELEYYTDRPKNIRLEEGNLILQAHLETVDSGITNLYPGFDTIPIEGGYKWTAKPDTFKHTSARITTAGKGDWKFGKIEVRAKIPEGGDGRGCWPAIWMLPTANVNGSWPKSGEMDIMEAYGPGMDTVHQTFHWWGGEGTKGSYVQTALAFHPGSWADDFHVYGLVWTRDKVTASVDGQVYVTRKNNGSVRQYPYIEKFHLLLNIAIGGGAVRGGTFGLTEFPQTMKVDYVRIYQDKNQDSIY